MTDQLHKAIQAAVDEWAQRHETCDARHIELEQELSEVKGSYDRACQTIAQMHAAAVGEVRGPDRGVVEDVEDVRHRLAAAEEAWEFAQEGQRKAIQEAAHLQGQIDQLATFIIEKVEGEPSESQGAVETIIRVLQETWDVLVFADGLAVKETGEPLANLYAKDSKAQRVLTAAGCHARDEMP